MPGGIKPWPVRTHEIWRSNEITTETPSSSYRSGVDPALHGGQCGTGGYYDSLSRHSRGPTPARLTRRTRSAASRPFRCGAKPTCIPVTPWMRACSATACCTTQAYRFAPRRGGRGLERAAGETVPSARLVGHRRSLRPDGFRAGHHEGRSGGHGNGAGQAVECRRSVPADRRP